jgi:hypothetical protein
MERRIGWRIWRSMVEREVFVLMLFGRNSRRRFEFLLFYFLGVIWDAESCTCLGRRD